MTHKDHIINLLKEVRQGGPNEGEGLKEYLERMASAILSYIPEELKEVKAAIKK